MKQKEIICNVCHNKVEEILFDWGFTSLMKCARCGLVFRRIAAELNEDELFAFVNRAGDAAMGPTGKYDASYGEDDCRVILWEKSLKEIGRMRLSPGRRLLDIGSAKGVFLDIAQKSGWEATGVEPSRGDSSYAKQVFGLDVFTGTLEEAGLPGNHFDVATMWDVIEHLRNPAMTIAETFRVLKPGGLIYVLTPNHDSLITSISNLAYRLTACRLPLERLLYPPVHLYYFTPRTLGDLLCRAGFKIKQVGSAPLHAEKCMISNAFMRMVASIIDFAAKPLKRGYRIVIIASKPLG